MHERSLARDVAQQVSYLLHQHAGARLTALRLQVGEFAGVDVALLGQSLSEILTQQGWEDVELTLCQVALAARCRGCHVEFEVARFRFECPLCENRDVEIVRGESLVLESMILESTDE
jgi:hydrogenase nickel incorporation protein HypA/HybF